MPDLLLSVNNCRSKFTVKQLRDRVRSELAVLDSVFISDANVDDWLLEFQNILARDEEWYIFTNSFQTQVGVRYYDLPPDCITVTHVQYNVWPLPQANLKDVVMKFPQALANPDAYRGPLPYFYSIEGANRLWLFPTPNVVSGVTIIYASLPPEPVSDDSLYYWPPYMDTAAIFYGCIRGCSKDFDRGGAKKLQAFTASYEREYMKGAAKIRGRDANDAIIYGKRQLSSGYGVNPYPWNNYPLPPGVN